MDVMSSETLYFVHTWTRETRFRLSCSVQMTAPVCWADWRPGRDGSSLGALGLFGMLVKLLGGGETSPQGVCGWIWRSNMSRWDADG